MSKKVVDTPIYVDTYKLVGIVYNLRFAIPKRDRAVLGDRLLAHFEVLKGLMRLCIDKKDCFALRERYGFRSVLQRKYKVRF